MEPINEAGVIVEFVRAEALSGWRIVAIQAGFPDAIIEVNGATYRAEFEFAASSFIKHGHDPRGCDLIICWVNDLQTPVIPIAAIGQEDWYVPPIPILTDGERELAFWKCKALAADYWKSRYRNLAASLVIPEDNEVEFKEEAPEVELELQPETARRIIETAAAIEEIWRDGGSKREMARAIGRVYAGNNCKLINAAIIYLEANNEITG